MSEQLVPAGFVRRALAFAVDFLPIAGGRSLAAVYFFGLDQILTALEAEPDNPAARAAYVAALQRILFYSLTAWTIYCAFADASPRQGTFGKKFFGLRAGDARGRRLTLQQSFRRNAAKFVSVLPLGLGFLWAAFSPSGRTWHDSLSGTGVYRAVTSAGSSDVAS